MYDASNDTEEWLVRLREICLALPEASEGGGVGAPTFRVRDKIFAMQHSMGGRRSLWCKGAPGVQQSLVASDSSCFFVPPYVGHHGWVGLYLDIALDWDLVTNLIEDSYRMTAPKRLAARMEAR